MSKYVKTVAAERAPVGVVIDFSGLEYTWGDAILGNPAEVAELVRRWVRYDWLRVAVGMVGFVCSIRAISIPFPPPPVARV
jgi:hypothetical protein